MSSESDDKLVSQENDMIASRAILNVIILDLNAEIEQR